METRVLRYFLTVVREESITKAAEVLHITQPTLSRQLAQLEDEIGVKLFSRGTRKIMLTNEGLLLRRRAEEIMELMDKTQKELIEQEEMIEGTIAVGCGELAAVRLLPDLFASFSNKYPHVNYDLYTANADQVKERMDRGLIDVGLLLQPVDIDKYDFIRLDIKERWVVIMRPDDPLAVKDCVSATDLKKLPIIISQIYMVSFVFSVISMVPVLVFSRQILGLLFGKVDADVMSASMTYLRILTISFPAVALYNAGAALFRSMGKTSITMKMSFIMNFINAAGGAIGIFAFHAGVAGVAWPATISWIIAAVVMTFLCFNINNPVNISWNEMFLWDWRMIKRLLGIAVPNGIENGLFQLAKVALGSIVALFGTTQIAANGVAQSIWSMAAVVGMAMGPAFITVTGQCIGAGDADAADYFMKKILRITFAASVLWNALTLAITPLFLMLYNLSDETKHLVFILVIIHNIFNAFVFPVAGPFSNALRAAGDVKFTMYVSIFTTVVCRVLLSILFGIWMNLGVIGIALAMVCDWCIKTLILIFRYRRGRWKEFRVI